MPKFTSINIPEEIKQKLLAGDKPKELFEVSYLSYIRADPRDVTEQTLGSVTVYMWAKDAREALRLVEQNIPTLDVNSEDQELPMLHLNAVVPVKPGISEETMLVITNPEASLPGDIEGTN